MIRSAFIKRDGRPGIEASIRHAVTPERQGLVRVQAFVTDARVYIVEAALLEPEMAGSKIVASFFESFELN